LTKVRKEEKRIAVQRLKNYKESSKQVWTDYHKELYVRTTRISQLAFVASRAAEENRQIDTDL
jgi:hypothetical protein